MTSQLGRTRVAFNCFALIFLHFSLPVSEALEHHLLYRLRNVFCIADSYWSVVRAVVCLFLAAS